MRGVVRLSKLISRKGLYEFFVAEVSASVARVEKGSFRRMMEVELVNDGPVTILLDSRKQF